MFLAQYTFTQIQISVLSINWQTQRGQPVLLCNRSHRAAGFWWAPRHRDSTDAKWFYAELQPYTLSPLVHIAPSLSPTALGWQFKPLLSFPANNSAWWPKANCFQKVFLIKWCFWKITMSTTWKISSDACKLPKPENWLFFSPLLVPKVKFFTWRSSTSVWLPLSTARLHVHESRKGKTHSSY